jgi:hypothetical protein
MLLQVPAAPPPPAAATPKVAIGGATPVEIPRTAAEIQRLRAKGKELGNQLESATDRRNEVISDLKDANVDARPGLEARLQVLDQRIVSLEQEIEANSRAIANAPLELVQRTEAPPAGRRSGPDPDVIVPVAGILGVFGLLPLAIGYTVRLLRRPVMPVPSPRDAQQDERLARMEQAIDTMAIELERITEGQRFVTKLMTEQAARGLGAGAAAPVAIPAREDVRDGGREGAR